MIREWQKNRNYPVSRGLKLIEIQTFKIVMNREWSS